MPTKDDHTQRKSLPARLGQWIAPLALILSMAVGGFQIYDNTVLRKQNEIASSRSSLADFVRKITEINGSLVSIQHSTSNAMAMKSLTQVLNLEKLSLLGQADSLITRQPDIASYASFMALSLEHINWGNVKRARNYVQSAYSLANTSVERVESRRVEAITWFVPSTIQDVERAQELFSDAIRNAKEIEIIGGALTGNVYRDWIASEAADGNCGRAKGLLKALETEMKEQYNGFRIWKTVMDEIFAATGGTSCAL